MTEVRTEPRHEPAPHDGELLTRHAGGAAPGAFAELVRRHVDLVYSAARAVVRDRHLAEDVTQDVFVLLARKADGLRERRDVGGWLYHAATLAARDTLKKRSREARRIEKLAQQRPADEKDPMASPAWQEIEPHLAEVVEALTEAEREAVVLRYFQRRPYDRIADALGVSETAARQRVHRGIERLRELLTRRGVTATTPALAAAIKLHGVQPAPTGLAARAIEAATHSLSAAAPVVQAAARGFGPFKSKALAAMVLGTTGAAAAGVATLLAIHHRPTESVYLDAQPNRAAGAPPVAIQAARSVRPPFQPISAKTYDDHHGTREIGGFVAYINKGDWLRFNQVDLGSPALQPATISFGVACPDAYAGNVIEVRADALDGPLVATLTVKSTGGYGNWHPQSTPLAGGFAGVHDLYLRFSGGGWNLDYFKVTFAHRPADAPILAVSFNDVRGAKARGGFLCDIEDGYWARYDGVDMGTGMKAVAVSYSSGSTRNDGKIGIRLDRPDGPLIAELPVANTGGWGLFRSRVLPIAELAGSHDVVLTFSGSAHGIVNVNWIQFVRQAPHATTEPATGSAAGSERGDHEPF